MKVRVYYEDTDAGGIVYHTNYIKYCERARSEIFFKQDMMPLDGDRSGFVVKNMEADFLGFATLGEILEVTTTVIKKRAASVLLRQQIYNQEGKNIFNMDIVLVFVREGRPSPVPDMLHEIFSVNKVYK
ncbi:MAG: YbgC/FadM family acyl-CoA thioesterase [Epsilonproteobacteria bacterium]|nr:YbgC/FadM family acyl-CoA thioesterase [Campylobacterota bacterium]